jgi:hypothetical protein
VSGLGALSAIGSPALGALGMYRRAQGCCGLGVDPTTGEGVDVAAGIGAGVGIALLVGGLALAGFLSYQAGKAMTPPGKSKKTWGWVGVPVGMFTGAPGLGIMGWVSNAKR